MAYTVREIRTFFGRHHAPCQTAIQKLLEKCELLGHVSDVMITAENIAVIAERVEENPGLFIPCLSCFWFGGVIGPYFFQNDAGVRVTVNELRYHEMINEI